MLWLFPSRVNLHVMSCVNIGFHGTFWHSTHEKLHGATRGMYRMCEVVVELYRMYYIGLHAKVHIDRMIKKIQNLKGK